MRVGKGYMMKESVCKSFPGVGGLGLYVLKDTSFHRSLLWRPLGTFIMGGVSAAQVSLKAFWDNIIQSFHFLFGGLLGLKGAGSWREATWSGERPYPP